MNKREIKWAISRMARLVKLWDHLLYWPEKSYILRRIRDKEPELFYRIANEEKGIRRRQEEWEKRWGAND